MGTRPARQSSTLGKALAFASAVIVSGILLPATVIACYFAYPEFFAQMLSVAADVTDPHSANFVWGDGR